MYQLDLSRKEASNVYPCSAKKMELLIKLVPVRSPDALAEAMLRFVEQPSLITSMGTHSRKLAEERFDANGWNSAIAALLTNDHSGGMIA